MLWFVLCVCFWNGSVGNQASHLANLGACCFALRAASLEKLNRRAEMYSVKNILHKVFLSKNVFLRLFKDFMCTGVLPACTSVYAVLTEDRRGHQIPGTGRSNKPSIELWVDSQCSHCRALTTSLPPLRKRALIWIIKVTTQSARHSCEDFDGLKWEDPPWQPIAKEGCGRRKLFFLLSLLASSSVVLLQH